MIQREMQLNREQIAILDSIIKSKSTKELSYDESLRFLLSKAKINFGTVRDNIKLGSMGSWAELAGDMDWYIPEIDFWIHGTCGKYCKGCFNPENPRKSACYCFKTYCMKTKRNNDGSVGDIVLNKCSVKTGHAYRTLAMLFFREYLLESLDNQLNRVKNTRSGKIRINEAGELTCKEDLLFWCELSKRHPEFQFYLYTKNLKAAKYCAEEDMISNNLFINLSIWHKFGIKEYLDLAWHPQIRAYVYVDREWTIDRYEKEGLHIQSMCGAYDIHGKMNHNITCDKCGNKHCCSHFNKVTGCFAH